jgi:ABC-type Na+ transport system ATPase subunit NatA
VTLSLCFPKIVPQKNVLFPELTCYQTLRVWSAVKGDGTQNEDIVQLLKDCDLGSKIHSNANTLSGGQKRKLQLAIGLIGGSKSKLPGFVIKSRLNQFIKLFLLMRCAAEDGQSTPYLTCRYLSQCTSGVDPLSRRSLWRILSSIRYDRTVVFTTHVSHLQFHIQGLHVW